MRSKLIHAAFALCMINPLAAAVAVTWDKSLTGFITQAMAFLVIAPMVAWLQISIALLTRRSRASTYSYCMVLLSLVAAADYLRFVFSIDLASSSTAANGLLLYPLIWQPLWVLPIGGVLVWLLRRKES